MKVLLRQDINKLGWLGDVVEVSEGYARNYLLPQGLAIVPTETNLKSLAKEKAKRQEQMTQERERLEKIASAINGAEAVVVAKANEQGHLFGSVTAHEIAANLREQGLLPNQPADVHRSMRSSTISPHIVFEDDEMKITDEVVQLPEYIQQVGNHSVILKFAEDLTATVNVVVVPEQRDESESGNQDK